MAGFNLGDIFVTFKAKTDDLKAGVTEVKNLTGQAEKTVNNTSFKGFATQASSAFGGVANAIQGVIVKATVLATTSSIGLGAFVKSAADLQQTSKSFEVLTGNVEVANKLFAQLARYANNTPFEFPEIAKAGQILLGFGIKSEDVYKRITMLGDIAAATGADYQSLALVFGQVNATGHLMGQDSLQLINNKIPITSILAKKLGITVQEVRDKMEAGQISVDLFNSALEDTTKAGGFAFHGTDVLAQSFNGRMSTLKDTVLEFGRNLLGVKVDPELGLVVQPGGLFDRLSNMLPVISAHLTEMVPKIQGFVDTIMRNKGTIIAALGAITAAFVTAKVAAVLFAIAAGANPFGLLIIGIELVIAGLAFLYIKFGWFRDAVNAVIDFIGGHWQQILSILTLGISDFVIGIINNWGAITGAFQRAFAFIVSSWQVAVSIFNSTISTVSSIFSAIANAVSAPFKAAFNAISTLWNNSIGKLSFKVPDWVPGLGGKGFSMPNLPYLATGVENFAGGWAVVGERGPELAYLPTGSNVYSNDKSKSMAAGGVKIYGDINIDSPGDADYFLRRIDRNTQLETMGLSPV